MLKIFVLFACFAALAVAQTPCSPNNIVDVAGAAGLSTLAGFLNTAGLTATLSSADSPAPFTVFGPTNQAFTNANLPTLNATQLDDVLKYHVIAGQNISSGDLAATQVATMLNTATATITKNGAAVKVQSYANVVNADNFACNGVAHVIDHVLIPPCAPARAGRISNAVEVAMAAGLNQLVSAAVTAGLDVTLSNDAPAGTGGYTIFAPTDAAFAAAGLSNPTAAELRNVLLFHVVSGRILSSDLQAANVVTTLQGGSLSVTVSGNTVTVNGGQTTGAVVATANVQACNAVIHVIDKVLLPAAAAHIIPTLAMVFGILLAVIVM